MHTASTWMSILILLAVGGCAARGNVEVLETQLRRQEQQLAQADSELSRLRSELSTAQRKADGLRDQLARQDARLMPEQLDLLYAASRITINSLVTGGLDTRETPGDEELHLLVTPESDDREPIRAPGTIAVSAFDLNDTREPRLIGEWTFSSEDAAKHWHRGFAGSGYQFSLPWQSPPESSTVLVRVRLTTVDGRNFDAAESVSVNPPAGRQASASTTPKSEAAEQPEPENPFASLRRQ